MIVNAKTRLSEFIDTDSSMIIVGLEHVTEFEDTEHSKHYPYYHCDLEDCFNEQGKARQIFKHLLSYSHKQSWLKQNQGLVLNTREDIDSWFQQNVVNQTMVTIIFDSKKWHDCSKSLLRGPQKANVEIKPDSKLGKLKPSKDSETSQTVNKKRVPENSFKDPPQQSSPYDSSTSPKAVDNVISRLCLESSQSSDINSSPTVNELLKDTDEEGNILTNETNHKESRNQIPGEHSSLDPLFPAGSYIRSMALGDTVLDVNLFPTPPERVHSDQRTESTINPIAMSENTNGVSSPPKEQVNSNKLTQESSIAMSENANVASFPPGEQLNSNKLVQESSTNMTKSSASKSKKSKPWPKPILIKSENTEPKPVKNEGPKDLLQRDVDNTEIEVTDTVLHKPKDPEYIFKENVGKGVNHYLQKYYIKLNSDARQILNEEEFTKICSYLCRYWREEIRESWKLENCPDAEGLVTPTLTENEIVCNYGIDLEIERYFDREEHYKDIVKNRDYKKMLSF